MQAAFYSSLLACAQDEFLDLYVNDEGEILDDVRYKKQDSRVI